MFVIPGPSQRVRPEVGHPHRACAMGTPARPDDELREEPGIHNPSAGLMDSGLAASAYALRASADSNPP